MTNLFGGHVKAQKIPTPNEIQTPYANNNGSTSSSAFGTNSIASQGNSINFQNQLSPELSQEFNNSSQAINNGLGYLNQRPDQLYSSLNNNPYYQQAQEQTRRNQATSLGQLMNQANLTGNDNSTAYGNALGTLSNDSILQQQNNATNAINTALGQAGQQVQLGGGIQNSIYNYQQGQQNNLQQLLQNSYAQQQANSQANSAALQQHDMTQAGLNQQAAAANAQARSQLLGSLGAIGGTILAGPIGGAIAGQMFGGGSQAAATPQIGSGLFGTGQGVSTNGLGTQITVPRLG